MDFHGSTQLLSLDFLGVIPGLAPGLVALLPQLLLLLFLGLGVILSPRSWWRAMRWVFRHPVKSLGLAGTIALLAWGGMRLSEALRPRPGEALAKSAGGFALGDARLHAFRASPGPRLRPERRELTLPAELRDLRLRLPLGRELLFCAPGSRRWCRLAVRSGELVARHELEAPLLRTPLVLERIRAPRRVILCLLEGESPRLSLRSMEGRELARCELSFRPSEDPVVVDDLCLLRDSRRLAAFRLAVAKAPELAWTRSLPEPIDLLVGDELARTFFTRDGVLYRAELASDRIEELGRFAGAPLALRSARGRVFLLVVLGESSSEVLAFDPTQESGQRLIWRSPAAQAKQLEVVGDRVLCYGPEGGESFTAADGQSPGLLPFADFGMKLFASAHSIFLASRAQVIRLRPQTLEPAWHVRIAKFSDVRESEGEVGLVELESALWVSRGEEHVLLVAKEEALSVHGAEWGGSASRARCRDDDELPFEVTLRSEQSFGAPPATEVSLLPLEEGLLLARSAEGSTSLELESVVPSPGRTIEGELRGLVRDAEGRLYLALATRSGAGRIVAVDPRSLEPRWSVPVERVIEEGALAVGSGTLLVLTGAGLRWLDAADGKRRGRGDDIVCRVPAWLEGRTARLAVDDFEGARRVLSFELATGAVEFDQRFGPWRSSASSWKATCSSGASNFLLSRGEAEASELYSILPDRHGAESFDVPLDRLAVTAEGVLAQGPGHVRWQPAAEGESPRSIPCVRGAARALPMAGLGFFIVAADRALIAYDTLTIDELWRIPLPAPPLDFVLAEGKVLVATADALLEYGEAE